MIVRISQNMEAQEAMVQFDHAVRLLQSPDTPASVHRQAFDYVDQITKSADGWKACAQLFLTGPFPFEGTKFQCLVVIEHAIKAKYAAMPTIEKAAIKEFLKSWLTSLTVNVSEPAYIYNKMAQLLALVFVAEYLSDWTEFFSDLASLIPNVGANVLNVFFRTLVTIHELVVEREMQALLTDEERTRNTAIKDKMRINSVALISDTWYHCLSSCTEEYPEICRLCLKSMAQYVSWIDIFLIVNDRLIPILFRLAESSQELQAESVLVFRAIIQKGMPPLAKVSLISDLNLLHSVSVLFQGVTEDDEGDFGESLGQLIAAIGIQLIDASKELKSVGENPSEATDRLESCIPLVCVVLGHRLDEISEQILPFIREYLVFAKGQEMTQSRYDNVAALLSTIMQKLRYDDDYDHLNRTDDDVIEFLDYRKSLEVLFDNINQLNTQLFLKVAANFASSILAKVGMQELHINDIEVALHIIFLMGASKSLASSEEIDSLMGIVTNGSITAYNVPIVSLKFFEVCVRLGKYFKSHTERLPVLLQAFTGEMGIRSPDGHVRSRACYWFLRFTKQHGRDVLHPFIAAIITSLQSICMEPPSTYNHEDQVFLFEALGLAVTGAHVDFPTQHVHMEGLIQPLIERYAEVVALIPQTSTTDELDQCISSLKHIILMTTCVSKGFTKLQQLQDSQCDKLFGQSLMVFMQSLSLPCDMHNVRTGIRTYLHRLIVCMGEGILPIIPEALLSMLNVQNCRAQDLREFVPLVNQIVDKFKEKVLPMLNEIFVPIVEATFANLNQAVEDNDFDTIDELKHLKRCYFEFLSCLAANSLSNVLISPQNIAHYEHILLTIVNGARGIQSGSGTETDVKAQKTCFNILKTLIREWYGKSEAGPPDFDKVVFTVILPACFETIFSAKFDVEDAWTYLVLGEIADCLMLMQSMTGAALAQFLQQYFHSISLNGSTVPTVVAVLQEKNKKKATKILKQLAESVKV